MRVVETLKKNTMLVVLVLVTLIFAGLTGGSMLNPASITNIVSQNGHIIILAIGMLLCILTGGNVDLSVGSIVALVSGFAAIFMQRMQLNVVVSIVLCLVIGLVVGAFQGFWIAYVRIPAFIVTLAGMLIWKGVAMVTLKQTTPVPDKTLSFIFNGSLPNLGPQMYLGGHAVNSTCIILGAVLAAVFVGMTLHRRSRLVKSGLIPEKLGVTLVKCLITAALILWFSLQFSRQKGFPMLLIILLVIFIAYQYFTSKTVPGRYLYAMGGNEKAAKLSGVNTNKILFGAYANMGVLAALAALVCVARAGSASMSAGDGYELDAIGACFIGGASAYGGIGTVAGAVIGAVFMGILNIGMGLMNIDPNAQKIVKGAVLLAAVAFDIISKQRSKAS